MKQTLIHNIGLMLVDNQHKPYLAGSEMSHAEILHDAWLLIEDGRFKDFGVDTIPNGCGDRIDAKGGAVMPSFCDSHTQVTATSRGTSAISTMLIPPRRSPQRALPSRNISEPTPADPSALITGPPSSILRMS